LRPGAEPGSAALSGHALSVAQSRGLTVPRVYLLAGREPVAGLTAVALTGHRERLRIGAAREHFADARARLQAATTVRLAREDAERREREHTRDRDFAI
jgi:hypothetical protein